jgi:cell pole-organizing protein PopZ
MSDANAQEPTMEEILASIRRIISEDETPQAAAPEASAPHADLEPEPAPAAMHAAPDEDVLELTDPVDPPPPPRAEPPPAQKYEETLGDLDVFSRPGGPPPPAPAAAPAFEHEPLVGSYAAEASASHFGALARSVAMPREGRTLEDVVRELLKPMLADWLDTHLPGIVEARVQAEVERISRRHDY